MQGFSRRRPNTTLPETGGVEAAPSIRRQVTSLAWPTVIEFTLFTVLQMVTVAMVGRLSDTDLAAVGVGQQVLMVTRVAFMGLSVGTTALVARSIGAGLFGRASVVAKQSLVLGLIISVFLAILGLSAAEPLFRIMGATDDVVAVGAGFLAVQMAASVFQAAMVLAAAAQRGAGDMKTPMAVNGLSTVVNVGLAYGLIFGELGMPRMEVTGAAWAAVAGQAVGAVVLLVTLFARKSYLRVPLLGGWRPDWEVNRTLLAVGGPSMVEQVMMTFGTTLYAILVIRLGTAMYATQSILFAAVNLSWMPGFAVAAAATTIVGQNVGARRFDQAERGGWAATEMGVFWMSLMGAVFFVFPRQCLSVFTSDPMLIDIGEPCLRIIGLVQPFSAVTFSLSGALRGAGDTRYPMFATAGGVWGVRLPLGYLFGLVLPFGLTGMWVAHSCDFIVRALLYLHRYRRGKWKYIRIRGEEPVLPDIAPT